MAQQKRSLVSRKQIIEAAMEEFGLYDYEQASINRFCATHQISKGRLYHQFENKEDIYCACIESCYEELEAYLSRFQPSASASLAEDLHAYYKNRIAFFIDHPYSVKIINRAVNTPLELLRPRIRRCRSEYSKKSEATLYGILKLHPQFRKEDYRQIVEVFVALTSYLHMAYGFYDWNPKEDMSYKLEDTLERFDRMMNLFIYGVLPR